MWFLIVAGLISAGPEVTVRPAAGQAVSGALVELSAERIVIEGAAGRATVPLKDVLSMAVSGSAPAVGAMPLVWVTLVDGSTLTGTQYRVAKGQGELTGLDGKPLKVPTRSIALVRLKEQTGRIAEQWAQIVEAPRGSDLIVIRRDTAIDFMEGVLGDVTADNVQFTLDGEVVPVKRPRVEGLVYFHKAAGELPTPLCQATCHDGSVLNAKSVTLADGRLRITTSSGLELTRALDQLSEVDFSAGKLYFLSDLDPDSVERASYFGGASAPLDRFYQPRMDRAFDGGPLQLGKATYDKGLALKSRTLLVYRLPGKFRRFEAVAGIDASVAPLGHVQLTIRGDDKQLFSAEIRGADEPLPLSLDLEGVKRLSIEVGYGEGGDVADYLDLCEAKIMK